MAKCYIAGPMRNKPEFNFPAFFEAEARLAAAGWVPFNPARLDVQAGEPYQNLTLEQQQAHAGAPSNTRRYAKRDLSILVDLLKAEDADALVLLPGWEESKGAQAEHAVAQWVGLRVLTLKEALSVLVESGRKA